MPPVDEIFEHFLAGHSLPSNPHFVYHYALCQAQAVAHINEGIHSTGEFARYLHGICYW